MGQSDERFRAEAERAVDQVASACPSFVADPEESGLPWIEAASVGRFLVEMIEQERAADTANAFMAIEQLLTSGSPGAVNVMTVGLMEAVDPRREDFAALLGPQSRRWWRGLNAYLAGEQEHLEPRDDEPPP